MDSRPQCYIDSVPQEIIDKIIDEAAELFDDKDSEARRYILGTISVTWTRMIPRAQDHLFKNITFYGNSGLIIGVKSLRGFNDWCKDRLQEQKLLPVHVAAVKKIAYFVLKDDGAPHDDADTCLKEFINVVKLAVAKRFDDRGEDIQLEPMFGKVLGRNIRFLKLGWYKLDVNDFVSYLYLFPKLKYFEMMGISFKEGAFQSTRLLPKFEGVLRLDSYGYDAWAATPPHQVIDTLTNIPTDMNYSHIILGSGVVKRGGADNCLKPFLLKNSDKLEFLDLSCGSVLAHDRLGVNSNLILY